MFLSFFLWLCKVISQNSPPFNSHSFMETKPRPATKFLSLLPVENTYDYQSVKLQFMSWIINQPTASWRLSFISNNLVTANSIDLCHNPLRVSYGPIGMKSAPHEICSISISKPTDQKYCTVDVVWAELRNLRKCGTSRLRVLFYSEQKFSENE